MTRRLLSLVACLVAAGSLRAAEVITLAAGTAAGVAPVGKEADWIHGDHAIRNDRIVAVIAKPVATRHANMTVRNVGGCIIDLTARERPNDQLSCYYPAAGVAEFRGATASADGGQPIAGEQLTVQGRRVRLEVASAAAAGRPAVTVAYELADGEDFLTVTTTWSNPAADAVPVSIADRVRADRTFTSAVAGDDNVAWWDDEWFGQTYAVVPIAARLKSSKPAAVVKLKDRDPLEFVPETGPLASLPPSGSVTLVRRVFPADNLLAARGIARRLTGRDAVRITATVRDAAGPVPGAILRVLDAAGGRFAAGRVDAAGRLAFTLPRDATAWKLVADATASGRGSVTVPLTFPTTGEPVDVEALLPRPGIVVGAITDETGRPVPCKVQFRGRGVADPDFGPDSGDTAVKNLVYPADGRFRVELAPGEYDVVVSRGPEYDAVTTSMTVAENTEAPLAARLTRVVDTSGWISSDFHSHSTPSGDNTSSQLGRVQNLLAEHIEFGPCTEHNRISSYARHLERLRAAHLMATCSGMELTGSLLPVNHQNAFPLLERPGEQDGGGPVVDNDDPVAQVERLALWDDAAEKVVQMNHPNLVQVLGDRDTDGKGDPGFERMLGFMDVIEVHPLEEIFTPPAPDFDPRRREHTVFRWLQMLNLGYRIPGVVNTDAHYNFHGSGFLRNYLASPTDDPATIRVADVIRSSEAGRIVMTSGPFLEAVATADGDPAAPAAAAARPAGPGETLRAAAGRVSLRIRVQCPNWFDVDRVQVFVNGRPDPALNFTRRAHAAMFTRDVVRFEQDVSLALDRDAHLVVATIGEGSNLGLVMGPDHAQRRPIAVTNPIFVDVDGGGFEPTGDLLGVPLHHADRPTPRGHRHTHGDHEDHPEGPPSPRQDRAP